MSMYAPTYGLTGGAADAPATPGFIPAAPSMLDAAQRYGDPRRVAGTRSGVNVGDPEYAVENRLANIQAAREGAVIPEFLLRTLPQLKTRTLRAMRMGDEKTVRENTGFIDRFVDEHFDDLAPWTHLENNGEWGKEVSTNTTIVADGSYKDVWTIQNADGTNTTVSAFLDDTSTEATAKKIADLSKTYGVSSETATAMVDPDSEMFPLFRSYGTALLAKPSTPEGVLAQNRAIPGIVSKLKFTESFVKDYGSRFGSVDATSQFLTEFDRIFNAGRVEAGDRLTKAVADGYLHEREGDPGMSATDWISMARDLSASVQNAMAPTSASRQASTQQGKHPVVSDIFDRARIHEANSITASFIEEVHRLGGSVAPGGLTAAGLAAAANRLAVASQAYGIDFRAGGATKVSRLVARMALANAGVTGADDGGVSRFLDGLQNSLDLLVGAETPADEQGNVTASPASEVETVMRRNVGRVLWDLRSKSPDRSYGDESVKTLVQRAFADAEARSAIISAISRALTDRFDDSRLAHTLAGEMVEGFASGDTRTLTDRLRDKTGIFDPDSKAPIIPANAMLDSSAEVTPKDIALLNVAPELAVKGASEDEAKVMRKFATSWANDLRDAGKAAEKDEALIGMIEWGGDSTLKPEVSQAVVRLARTTNEERIDVPRAEFGPLVARVQQGADADAMIAAAMLLKRGGTTERREPQVMPSTAGAFIATDIVDIAPRLRDAFARAGIAIGGDPVQSVINHLALKGALEASALVMSGYLDPMTGVLSEKRMLVNMQTKSYADPLATGVDELPTPEQQAARKAYSSLQTKGSVIGSAMERYTQHLAQQGYNADEVNVAKGRVASRFAAAYKDGGAIGVEKLLRSMTERRIRYVPAQRRGANGEPVPGSYSYDHVVPLTKQMNDAEFDEYLENEQSKYKTPGIDIRTNFDPRRVRELDASGPAMYRRQLRMLEKARQIGLNAAARSEATSSSDGW